MKFEASQKQPIAHQIRAAHGGGVDRARVVLLNSTRLYFKFGIAKGWGEIFSCDGEGKDRGWEMQYVVPELQTFLCVCVCLPCREDL